MGAITHEVHTTPRPYAWKISALFISLTLVICSASPYATPHVHLPLDLRAQPPNLQAPTDPVTNLLSIGHVSNAATRHILHGRMDYSSAWSREMQIELAWRYDTAGSGGAIRNRTVSTDLFLMASAGCWGDQLQAFGVSVLEQVVLVRSKWVSTYFLSAAPTGCGKASALALTELAWRKEQGIDTLQDGPTALRMYAEASRMGNTAASNAVEFFGSLADHEEVTCLLDPHRVSSLLNCAADRAVPFQGR